MKKIIARYRAKIQSLLTEEKRRTLYIIIFRADTPVGKFFDLTLMAFIVASVVTVMLESVTSIQQKYGTVLNVLEWVFTIVFTIEYILRLWTVRHPWNYAKSFYGVIDLLSILPTYLSFFLVRSEYLIVIRALRLMRIFRILKLGHFSEQGHIITSALRASRHKIMVFLSFVMVLVLILGSLMYLIEGNANSGFTSIPRSVYWAIVTLTTVGYGDIAPVTPFGQFIAAIVMIMGYSVIAVPTGIVSAEFITVSADKGNGELRVCENCTREGHDMDAKYCKYCGERL